MLEELTTEVAKLHLDELTAKVAKLHEELQTYKAKPTKAGSKRIRLLLGYIKKNTAFYRAHMVNLDKASQ